MSEIIKLENGIRLVLETLPYVQSVSVGLWFRAGSADENETTSGISHFIEHMMFKGTENRSAKDIASDIDKIGGQFNAFTGKEATCYYVRTLSEHYKEACEVLIDMVNNSLFNEEELNKERKVILEEIKMSKDVPDELAHDEVMEMVFSGSEYSRPIIGTPESLEGIGREEIKKYIKEQYTRDSLVISVAGNFDRDDVVDFFNMKFPKLTPSKKKRKLDKKPYKPASKAIVKDIEQSHIFLVNRCIPRTDKRFYALNIMCNALGGSMSSRLFQNIRERKGLAYSVYSVYGSMSDDGYFLIYAGVSHDKIEDAINGIKEELALLSEEGITMEELNSSKEQIKSAYAFEEENVNARMMTNGKNLTIFDEFFDAKTILDNYSAVTLEDVKEVSKLVSNIGDYTSVIATNREIDIEKLIRG